MQTRPIFTASVEKAVDPWVGTKHDNRLQGHWYLGALRTAKRIRNMFIIVHASLLSDSKLEISSILCRIKSGNQTKWCYLVGGHLFYSSSGNSGRLEEDVCVLSCCHNQAMELETSASDHSQRDVLNWRTFCDQTLQRLPQRCQDVCLVSPSMLHYLCLHEAWHKLSLIPRLKEKSLGMRPF